MKKKYVSKQSLLSRLADKIRVRSAAAGIG
jgi:hypothetical protein